MHVHMHDVGLDHTRSARAKSRPCPSWHQLVHPARQKPSDLRKRITNRPADVRFTIGHADAYRTAINGRDVRPARPTPTTFLDRQGQRPTDVVFPTSLEVDDDLPPYVPPRLKFDRGANLFDRKAGRDRHPQAARCNQAGDLREGARGCVGAVRRCDAVDLGGDGRDALVGNADFACRERRVRPVQVRGRGDAGGSQRTDPIDQTIAIGDRLDPERAQGRAGR